MPVIISNLSGAIQTEVDSDMASIAGVHPLAQRNPSYFIEMCTAIATGIVNGGPTITFTTSDTGTEGSPPVEGSGSGTGIIVDSSFFTQDLYSRARGYVIADFGNTTHQPYPPQAGNSGQYLLALCQGIGEAIAEIFAEEWVLTSQHPNIYVGTGIINNGDFSGLSALSIASAMVGAAPNFIGKFWPRLAQAISESYVLVITEHSTGHVTITGECIPSDNQACGISGTGSGSGIAS